MATRKKAASASALSDAIQLIPLKALKGGLETRRPEKVSDDDPMMQSMRESGLRVPIGVIPLGSGFRVVYGYRRWARAVKLGWSHIDARVMPPDTDVGLARLLENMFRLDNTVPEHAQLMCNMLDDGWEAEKLANNIGVSKTYPYQLARAWRLLKANERNMWLEKPNMFSVKALVKLSSEKDPKKRRQGVEAMVKGTPTPAVPKLRGRKVILAILEALAESKGTPAETGFRQALEWVLGQSEWTPVPTNENGDE